MSKFIGGPLDGQSSDFYNIPSFRATYTARMEISGDGIVTRQAPYRYKASEDGQDWIFDSWGRDVIEDRPTVVDTIYDMDAPVWGTVKPTHTWD